MSRPLEASAADIVDYLLIAAFFANELEIDPEAGMAMGPSGTRPVVWLHLQGLDLVFSTATARDAAGRIAADEHLALIIEDPAALGRRFTRAAEEAEALAAPFMERQHGNQIA